MRSVALCATLFHVGHHSLWLLGIATVLYAAAVVLLRRLHASPRHLVWLVVGVGALFQLVALTRSPLPKLLLTGEPGALVRAPLVAWCRENLPALEVVPVGNGIHYLQEDHPHEIGAAIADWMRRTAGTSRVNTISATSRPAA